MNRTGMHPAVRWVLAVVALQAGLFGLYWLVEQQRVPQAAEVLGTQPPQSVDMAVPSLTLQQHDGSRVDISSTKGPTLLHVWATWCPPCRTELPGLLQLPSEHAVNVVAIALDANWAPVDRFLNDQFSDGVGASNVFLGDSRAVERALGVRSLPVTFLVVDGRIQLRFDGARDWTDEAFVASQLEESVDEH